MEERRLSEVLEQTGLSDAAPGAEGVPVPPHHHHAAAFCEITCLLEFSFPCCFKRLHCCARVRLHRKPEGRAPICIGRRKQSTGHLRGQEFNRRQGIGCCQTPNSKKRNASVSAWSEDRDDVNEQDKLTVKCSGGISAAVGDIKATKEITFTVQQSSDGKISVSVDPFQF